MNNNQIITRSNEVKAISSQWIDYCNSHNIDSTPIWYLYNLSCGWLISENEAKILADWVKNLNHEKKDVKIVDNFLQSI
jgi:hypothetical protein